MPEKLEHSASVQRKSQRGQYKLHPRQHWEGKKKSFTMKCPGHRSPIIECVMHREIPKFLVSALVHDSCVLCKGTTIYNSLLSWYFVFLILACYNSNHAPPATTYGLDFKLLEMLRSVIIYEASEHVLCIHYSIYHNTS